MYKNFASYVSLHGLLYSRSKQNITHWNTCEWRTLLWLIPITILAGGPIYQSPYFPRLVCSFDCVNVYVCFR